jgi:hypothetical protein
LGRIGAVGDVHADNGFLAAAIRSLGARGLDLVVCVGDILDGNGDVNRWCDILERDQIPAPFFQRRPGMRESTTYQYILEEEARKILLRLAQKRFGPPEIPIRVALESITDLERLEHMTERVSEVSGWEELLRTT